jgi:hypothetical protein
MPVRKVSDNPDCYQWGNQKIYCGKGAKEKAIKQGIAIVNTGWKEAEGETKKIPIEDIEIGSIFIFPNGDRYVLNEKEIDGERVKVLFNPFHHLKAISDIQGEIKLGTKFLVSSPRKELLKERFGLGAESSKPHSITISRSSNPEKKLMAIFKDNDGNKIKTTHFGQRGASDYTKHGEKERMERYLERHGGGTTTSTKEDWKDPTTAGALSRWILWNKPSLSASFADYKRRFGLKGTMGVSKSAETFSAEKVKKEILEDDWQGLKMKFIYKDREGKLSWSDNDDGKGGVLSFGDDPFKKGEQMSRLPHSQTIDSATSKLAAKEMFRLSLDRKCHTCKEPIYKKDIGSCAWCEDEMGPSKFDDTYFYEDDWFKRLGAIKQDEYIHDLANKNPYCRDCLYYYGGLGDNYPNKFDRESANYWLGNAVCETHWAEIVADGGLSKDTKRYSLYEIENISPRERMMKKRFGFGAEYYEKNQLKERLGLPKLLKMDLQSPGKDGVMRDGYVIFEEVNYPKTDRNYFGFTEKGKIHIVYPLWDCGCENKNCEQCNRIKPYSWKFCAGAGLRKHFAGQLYRAKVLKHDIRYYSGGANFEKNPKNIMYHLERQGKICKLCSRKVKDYHDIGFGAEETTNKVLVVGGIIAGLIGLNKLLGK